MDRVYLLSGLTIVGKYLFATVLDSESLGRVYSEFSGTSNLKVSLVFLCRTTGRL
jgi:hypothetical protein